MRTEFFLEGGIRESALDSVDVTICNLQGTKFDHFNIKSLKAKCIEFIDEDVFPAFTYLGFNLEYKAKKYIQIFSKVYFLACALSLLVDHIS